MHKLLCCLILSISTGLSNAVDMQDFNLLGKGMSEAQILYRIGPPNHTVSNHDHHYTSKKTWFYIPPHNSDNKWITELQFNADGKLIKRDRYRAE